MTGITFKKDLQCTEDARTSIFYFWNIIDHLQNVCEELAEYSMQLVLIFQVEEWLAIT